MMIKEAMSVFWQSLKDTWEELFSLAIVNVIWLFASLTIVGFPICTAAMYYVTNRVAHGKTFHFSDFVDGIKRYWWRSLLWLLATIFVIILIIVALNFYSSLFQGIWAALVGGIWLAALVFWLSMQMYFWPMMMEQKEPKMFQAWRNAAFLILANPFFAFFVGTFHILLFGISTALTLPLIFAGMALMGILGNNAVLTLLAKFGLIKEARPKSSL
jgi:hypothetical protein